MVDACVSTSDLFISGGIDGCLVLLIPFIEVIELVAVWWAWAGTVVRGKTGRGGGSQVHPQWHRW
eukprot:m.273925 g.273925  ORF g.273925 m.273925 type:complete len:65 (-) comp19756_c0_seq22:2489-2683(-)